MGTNYYWVKLKSEPCSHCGRFDQEEERHIGKSSAGWCFSLHVYPAEGINTLEDWEKLMGQPGSLIRDEYGGTVSVDEMLSRIRDRKWDRRKPTVMELIQNDAEAGPNGLLRHRMDGYCVGHGEGTWDYIDGDFS